VGQLDEFLKSQGLEPEPERVPALRGDEARAAFIERFREVQRLKTQLDQYTDLAPETKAEIEQLLPQEQLNAFRGVYLATAQDLDEKAIREGYQRFKAGRNAAELAAVAHKHGLSTERFRAFTDTILQRMVFDGEQLTELMEPLGLGWRERRVKELALMDDLVPLLKKRAAGRNISGLNAYES